jgi:type I restriction enzyme S subunit
MLQQLLTGKTRFKGFENGSWRTVRIGSLLEACDRYVDWSNDQTYRFASIRRRSGGLFDRGTFYGREVKTKVLKLLKAGDFVISKRQVVHGAWAMVTRPFDGFGVSDEYDVLVNRDPRTLDMRFFNYLSQTRRLWHVAYLASNGVHIEKLIFDYDDFAKEKVKIPPTVEEQARIVEVLSACDREIVLLQKQLEALKDQKRGLMQKLLTGQVRVKTEVLKAGNGRRKAGIPNDEDSTANIEVRPGKSAKE